MSQYEQYDELNQFDQDFNPSPGRRPGLEALADGVYDFEVLSADLARTEKTNELVLRLGLKVLATGLVVESTYFFRTQRNVDILGSDLCTLGLDSDQWKAPARPFSRELPTALPRLRGVRFRGKKHQAENRQDPTKPYHNLYVNQRLDGPSAPPPAYAPAAADDVPF
jgi:hypothetical protein